jgi:cytochrome c oxidase subunit 1
MVWAIIGGFMSDFQLSWLSGLYVSQDILGNGLGWKISPEAYYSLVTMHGTVLVFFVLTGGLSGTFANFLIPLQIGARDMASPFLNMLSYWFFWMASVVMISSLFIETGPAAGGWTSYPPLSALGDASIGSKGGMDFWITSMALFVVSSLLGGLNYITTILNMRTKGMSMTRLPLTIWALFFPAILRTFIPRAPSTHITDSDIFIAPTKAPNEGGSPILFQHLSVPGSPGSLYHHPSRHGTGF